MISLIRGSCKNKEKSDVFVPTYGHTGELCASRLRFWTQMMMVVTDSRGLMQRKVQRRAENKMGIMTAFQGNRPGGIHNERSLAMHMDKAIRSFQVLSL